jgi:hypothetical protein
MRHALVLSALALVAASIPTGLAAQDSLKKPIVPGAIQQGKLETPQLPSKPVLETIAISSFDVRQATSGGFQLVASVQGMTPTQYQVSQFSDFRNATWLAWPSTNRPIWSGSADGACGQNVVKIVANFRVRAFRLSTQSFTMSNAVRDTLCLPFG